jgi:hypothetical protein
MLKRCAFRFLTAASLLLGSSIAVGASQADAQWTTQPRADPIECSSWNTAHNGGMCRVEHFNQTPSVSIRPAGPALQLGQGLTGINTGANTNAAPITSGSEAGGGSGSASSGGSAGGGGSGGAGGSAGGGSGGGGGPGGQ